jgi:predicted  nucleic acid-binding Zn-ribbon protein
MDSLTAKITAEGEAEAKAFKEYFAWCDDAAANLHYEIKTGSKEQEDLEASIGKATADIDASTSKIEDLSSSISADEKELKEATAVRKEEVATLKPVKGADRSDRQFGSCYRHHPKGHVEESCRARTGGHQES